jgi:hypothetical protein
MQASLEGFFKKRPAEVVAASPAKQTKVGASPAQGDPSDVSSLPPLANGLNEITWRRALANEFNKPVAQSLASFLKAEETAGKTIYPPKELIWTALNLCPLPSVKVCSCSFVRKMSDLRVVLR